MLLIGSVAAKLTDCLPVWREGRTVDVDMVGTTVEMQDLLARLKRDDLAAMAHKRRNGKYLLVAHKQPHIEFDVSITPATLLLQTMHDNTVGEFMGLPVKLISCATQYVIKEAYADYEIHRDKNDKDLAYWRGVQLTPQHHELARLMRKEMAAKFGHLKRK
jgi:hypothetical protein